MVHSTEPNNILTHLLPMVFWCFQGVEKGWIGDKWTNKVKTGQTPWILLNEFPKACDCLSRVLSLAQF